MTFRWMTVFLDFRADAFEAGVAFWREVTGCGLSEFRGPAKDFATLLPPSGDAYLRVQRLLSGGGGCHLDLHTPAGSLEEEADRAVALGARVRHREAGELIVADSPGGFTFCLVRWEGERFLPPPDGGSRVDTLCLDVPPARFDAEVAFWSALTGGEARPAPVPGFTSLKGPAGMPVRLLLQRLDDAAPGQRVRAHVDIGATDVASEVARHTGLGARVTATLPYWTVLADPAGREYCVVLRRPRGSGG
ncbi:MAG TPA: VOC family protein [Trebonia sp.]